MISGWPSVAIAGTVRSILELPVSVPLPFKSMQPSDDHRKRKEIKVLFLKKWQKWRLRTYNLKKKKKNPAGCQVQDADVHTRWPADSVSPLSLGDLVVPGQSCSPS